MTSRSSPSPVRTSTWPRLRLLPSLEGLEGRTLLSYGGSPDPSFGTGGSTQLSGSFTGIPEFSQYDATASVLQSNGDLVVVGSHGTSNEVGGSFQGFFAVRYTPTGALDPAFNQTTLASDSSLQAEDDILKQGYSAATGVALQTNGQIVVVGDINNTAKVIRLNSDGTLDTTFGTGGILTLGTAAKGDSMLDYASGVAILPGGQIAVAGAVEPTTAGQDTPAAEVFNADGSADTSFGTNGLAILPLPSGAQSFAPIVPPFSSQSYFSSNPVSLAVASSGTLVVVGDAIPTNGTASNTEIVATRLTASGTLDSTFGTGGQETLAGSSILGSVTGITATAAALQTDGSLIVGGSIFIPGEVGHMVVERFTPAGVPDPAFGVGGANILPTASYFGETVGALAIQGDGKIVIADANGENFERLDANGLPDNSFGAGGMALYYDTSTVLQTMPRSLGQIGTVGLAITATGKILATQNADEASVLQLLSQGASGDYDGDGISDRSIYLTTTGQFAYSPSSGGTGPIIQFGPTGAGLSLPAPGAYGGEGQDELAIYIPSEGAFAIMSLNGGGSVLAPFGTQGAGNSLPAPGDYDASGATELGVYLPATGTYAYRPANGGPDVDIQIGAAGAGQSIPAPGDYFGTGQDDVAVYEPASGAFIIRNPVTGQDVTIPFGASGAGQSIPVPGDYDGSGKTELAVYIPSLAALFYRPANGGGDVEMAFGTPGAGATLPAPGDYDGSGKTEVAAYLPAPAIFAYRPAGGGNDVDEQFGVPGQTVPFSLATDSVAEEGLGGASGSPGAEMVGTAVEVPLTQDLLDTLAGPAAKKSRQF